jgi:hypothetical protein
MCARSICLDAGCDDHDSCRTHRLRRLLVPLDGQRDPVRARVSVLSRAGAAERGPCAPDIYCVCSPLLTDQHQEHADAGYAC